MPATPVTTEPLQDRDARSLSPAYARVLRSLAGRVRYLSELVYGDSVKTGDAPVTPRNPGGGIGIDYSGPPWGSCFRHPLVWQGGLKPDTSGAGDWEGHRTINVVTSDEPLSVTICFYVRPFATSTDVDVPYSRGYPLLSLYKVSGNADVVVTCRQTPGNDATATSDTVSVTSTTEAMFEPSCWFKVKPGRNYCELLLTTTSADGVALASFSINQIVKRRHP